MKNKKIFEAKEFNNIKEIIYNSAKKYENNTAFVIKHKEDGKVNYENVTYKRLLQDINKLGTSLYDMNMQNKRIAIIGKNRYEWVIAHLANLLGGIVSIPLDKDLQYDELESSLIRSKADLIVFDEKLKDKIDEIKQQGNTNAKEFICMSKIDGYSCITDLMEAGTGLISSGDTRFIDCKIDNNKMNILLFTSGTTDKSKAVMLSQNNIASNVYAMQLVENFYDTDVNLAFLPMHHTFGCTGFLFFLSNGARSVFCDGIRHIQSNLKEYKVSVFVCVPLLLEMMYKKINQEVERQGKTKILSIARKISNVLLKIGIDVRRKLFKMIIDNLGGNIRLVVSRSCCN